MWLLWVAGSLVFLLVVEFIIICPDKLPFRRRKK